MRRTSYIGPDKPSGDVSGIFGLYDQYQAKQSGQWTEGLTQQQWVRPDDWLAMPSFAPGEEKFAGLFGVWPFGVGNPCSIYCDDAFTVDWGDGTVTNYGAGIVATHLYSFDSINPVTQTSKGYRQVMVIVTPQGGATITNFQLSNSGAVDSVAPYSTTFNWLDLQINFASATSMSLGNRFIRSRNTINCQRLIVGPNQITNFSSFCAEWTDLQYADIYTDNGTNFSEMFLETPSLTIAPRINTINGTDLSWMFSSSAVETIPHYDFSNATNISNMFYNSRIRAVPPLTFPLATNATSMFQYSWLDHLEYIDLPSVTNTTNMFNASKIRSIGIIKTPNATNMVNMFYNCSYLKSINSIDTSKNQNFTAMFFNCRVLSNLPDLDTSNATGTYDSTFEGTRLLTKMPTMNYSNISSCSQMFQSSGITTVPDLNLSNVTNFTRMFAGTSTLHTVGNLNCSNGITFDYMFSENYGISTVSTIGNLYTPSGTSFVGLFNQTPCLMEVPQGLDTTNAIDCSSMFNVCSVPIIPNLNTSNCRIFDNMFNSFGGADQLQKIGEINLAAATSQTNFISSRPNLANILVYGSTLSINVSGSSLSKKNLEIVFKNLGTANNIPGSQSVTISSNWGVPTSYSKSVGTTSGNAIITCSDTSNLSAGMLVTGTGISDAVAVTFTDAGDTVNLAGHGLSNGTNISFTSITTTTGISTYTVYYVINAGLNDFQIASTPSGGAIALTNDGSGNMLYPSFISSYNTNANITLTAPASATGTITASFRNLDTSYAIQKGWTVVG